MNPTTDTRVPNHAFTNHQSTGSKKGLLFAGCGCLGVLLVLCVSGGLLGYLRWAKPSQDFRAECEALIAESPRVQNLLGAPVSVHSPSFWFSNNERIEIHFPVKGTEEEGTIEIHGVKRHEGNFLTGKTTIERTSATLKHNGETTELNPDDATPEIIMNTGD